jgi:ECF transporter S component (folate family)
MFRKSVLEKSVLELINLRTLTVVAMLIAVSTVLSFYTIQPTPWLKINFSFLASAAIGMIGGPVLGFMSGAICDVTGFLVHPDGPFLPLYTLIGMFQGLLYGLVLYHKNDKFSIMLRNNVTDKTTDVTLFLRAFVARLLDVVIVNLIFNTQANIYYGFIPKESSTTVILTRLAKNFTEFFVDIPLLFILLPPILFMYKRIFVKKKVS